MSANIELEGEIILIQL